MRSWVAQGYEDLPHHFQRSITDLELFLRFVSHTLLVELRSTRNEKIVLAPSHGATAAGELWGHNGSSWVKAQASSSGTPALGLCTSIPDADHLRLAVSGWHAREGHGFAVGKHWTSTSTPGATQTTAPGPGNRVQLAMHVVSSDDFIMFPTEAFP